MSQQSHRLAQIYNADRVARARTFLAQRQEEAAQQEQRIEEALGICREITRWHDQVQIAEAVVASRLAQLDEQLQAVLPALGYGFGAAPQPARGRNATEAPAAPPPGTPETPGTPGTPEMAETLEAVGATGGRSISRPEGLVVPIKPAAE
jgi:hypothetical protein